MPQTFVAPLPDRGVISVSGPDAQKLLQGLFTNDIDLVSDERAIFAGLLTPQGKILFDFFVVKAGEGYLLEVARDKAADLVKRLMMYKLRAQVDIRDASGAFRVLALWGAKPTSPGQTSATRSFTDPRVPDLGLRILAEAAFAAGIASATNGTDATAGDYHAHRIALGVPEGGRDYAYGDTFPHEALYDQLHGVSFTKGCFVGQEIVSRMEHRGTARKRIVSCVGAADLPPPGTEIVAGGVAIGTMGSSNGPQGLGLLRLDRAAEFKAKGAAITAAGVALTYAKAEWATFSLTPPVQD